MDSFEHKVYRTVKRISLLSEGQSVMAAFSGGADSTALVLALISLVPILDLRVEAAHINHGLRGEESDRDETFVRDFCTGRGIRLRVGRLSRPPGRGSSNLEAALRQERYHLLGRLARESGCILATGHTQSDQAETVLMKLVRGAGPTGLSGVAASRELRVSGTRVRVVRPLIEVTRAETLQYLGRLGQTFCIDRTNEDLEIDRNWIRHRLLPLLEERLNPAVVPVLARSAALFREIEGFLESQGRPALRKCLLPDSETVLDLKALTELPGILQKEVVRLALRNSLGSLEGITQAHVEQVLELLSGGSGRSVSLPDGWRAVREFETVRITRRPAPSDFEVELCIPGDVLLEQLNKRLLVRPALESQETRARLPGILFRTGSRVGRVRNWRAGDRFELGPGRTRRLKRIFLERRVSAEDRSRRLLLVCGGQVVWVEGIGVAFSWRASAPGEDVFEIRVV